jgi:hypothetical protein
MIGLVPMPKYGCHPDEGGSCPVVLQAAAEKYLLKVKVGLIFGAGAF